MIRRIVTAKDTAERLTELEPVVMDQVAKHALKPLVELETECQTIMGFGGAFTEAAAVTLSKMSADKRQEVLEAYYSKDTGHGYSIGRVHIHSCDFALGNYTYVDEGDVALSSFNIDHDREFILPLIKEAMAVRGSGLEILASPWSPPGWMKDTNEMNHGGKLLPEFARAWATYYTKFIAAYEEAGVPIWGITVQNEPDAVQIWDSCIYSGEEERDFVKKHLGPVMEEAGYADKKLLIWDHNRDIMVERAKAVLSDPEAAKYVWGTGFHWYVSEAFENVGKVHDLFPDKHLLFTEGCQEGGVHLESWITGERYGRNMLGDLNNWCKGYLDWNIVLDETGGPNHVGNLCDAPIICDTRTDEVIYNSSYFYIGHFSRFVMPGAKGLKTVFDEEGVYAAAFRNPDGSLVVILMNERDQEAAVSLSLGGYFLNLKIKAHSIETLVDASIQ